MDTKKRYYRLYFTNSFDRKMHNNNTSSGDHEPHKRNQNSPA